MSNNDFPNEPFNPEDVKVWEKIIDVQKHFNDVKSKNQTLFVSLVTAALVATGYLYQYQTQSAQPIIFSIPKITINFHVYTLPILGAALFTIPFYILDCGIYQILLKGAVECGESFERRRLKWPLTSVEIEKHSKHHRTFLIRGAGNKLKAFYILIGFGLLILFLIFNIFS